MSEQDCVWSSDNVQHAEGLQLRLATSISPQCTVHTLQFLKYSLLHFTLHTLSHDLVGGCNPSEKYYIAGLTIRTYFGKM